MSISDIVEDDIPSSSYFVRKTSKMKRKRLRTWRLSGKTVFSMNYSTSYDGSSVSLDCPACKQRGSNSKRSNANCRDENGQTIRRRSRKGHKIVEEHWTKVLQANQKACAFNRPCNCRNIERCHSFKRRHGYRKDVDNSVTALSSVFRRFCMWVNSKWKLHERNIDAGGRGIRRLPWVAAAESTFHLTDSDLSGYESSEYQYPRVGLYCNNFDNSSISDSDDPNYVYIRSKTSPQLSSQCNSNELNTSESKQYLSVPQVYHHKPVQSPKSNSGESSRSHSPERQPLTVTTSCPTKSHSTSRHVDDNRQHVNFFGTWPLTRRRQISYEEEIDSVFDDEPASISPFSSDNRGTGDEFVIPYDDLEFGNLKRAGRNCCIYSGRWHGNVNIHYFGSLKKEESSEFWSKVTQLHRIRHENIALFMGACVNPQHYAVVLSIQDGISLYEHIHIQKEKMTLQSKVQLLRQVAYGMGYLHAKGIVLKTLSTRNVFMCPKARISVMDNGFAEKNYDRIAHACLPRGQLTYISPEILSTMKVVPPQLISSESPTLQSDIFAFGTVIYEILTGRYPYYNVDAETIIWKVCKGQRQDLQRVKGTRMMKSLIEFCWSHNASKRPSFAEISKELHRNVSLHKRFSASQPESLNTQNISSGFI